MKDFSTLLDLIAESEFDMDERQVEPMVAVVSEAVRRWFEFYENGISLNCKSRSSVVTLNTSGVLQRFRASYDG